jgi:hypothetical protein
MQTLGFGRIEGLIVQGGQPVFKPMPRIMQEVRLGPAERLPRPGDDFVLKDQVHQFLARLEQIGDGRLEWLDVAHGLPFRFVMEPSPHAFAEDEE